VGIEEILAAMQAIVDGADGRSFTDDEVKQYEELEAKLAAANTDRELRARNAAYRTPVPAAAIHVNPSTADPHEDLNRAFENYLRTGTPNADLQELRVGSGGPRNAQEAGTTTEGGYTVSPEFRQKLVEVRKAFGGFAAEVEDFSTETGAALTYPSLDDTANEGAIDDEEAQITDGDDLVFGEVGLGAFKYTATGGDGAGTGLRVSWELLQDSAFDIQGLVARALATRIQRKQASDWINGTGTTLPVGIFQDATTADVVLDSEATLIYLNLLETEAALDEAYDANAKWLMSRTTWVTVIRALEDVNERPLILPQAASGIGQRPAREVLGYPVVLDAACNAITADGGTGPFMGLGDWRESYVIRRVSPFVLVVDPYTRAGNGQVQYFGWERADGNIQNRSAYAAVENITT
jgi:HK97 family phage major capsid protein